VSTPRRLRAVSDLPLRFGIAVRVSRVMGRSGPAFHSPETQEINARRAVEALGGLVVESVGARGVFFDLDVSGAVTPSDRPGLGEALELVRAGVLDGIAVADLSRWSRETVSGLSELQEVRRLGGQVISAAETIDLETPGGVFATTVQLAAAQMRRDQAADAWRATHQRRFEKGRAHGAVPLGYRRDPDTGDVEPDPVLQQAVVRAFEDFAAGTVSQVQLAQRLSQARGRRVWQATVSDVLRSPFYLGKVRLGGEVRDGQHPALVQQDVWDAVQRRLQREAAVRSPRERGKTHSLVGLLVCDVCDHALWRRGGSQRSPHILVSCRTAKDKAGCPGIGNPRFQEIEDAVLAEVVEAARLLRDNTAELARRDARQARAAVDVAKLRAEARELEEAIGNAGVQLVRKVMTEKAYTATVTRLEQALTAVQEQLLDAEDRVAAPAAEALASAAELLAVEWKAGMTPAEKRAALAPFVKQVRVRPAARPGEPVKDRVRVVPYEMV
jgi:DNA invertase Pin-like site-specific DNA recombinase